MIKLIVNLNNDKIILKAITSYFKGASSADDNLKSEYNIDVMVKQIAKAETLFSPAFSKCVCDDENGWFIVVCSLDSASAEMNKINALYNNLKRICGDKLYLIISFSDRAVAGALAWENNNTYIDIQATPKNNDWGEIFDNAHDLLSKIETQTALKKENVILYGYKPYVASSYIKVNYICDSSCKGTVEVNGERVQVISKEKMIADKKAFVLIGFSDPVHKAEAAEFLKSKDIKFDYLDNFAVKSYIVYLDNMVSKSVACYRDIWNNKFVYAGSRPLKLPICVQAFSADRKVLNNRVYIGKNFQSSMPQNSYLRIRSSNNSIYISDNVELISGEIIISESQNVKIGSNTIIGRNSVLRCMVSYLSFDIKTKALIPVKKDIIIGDHVWVGEDCYFANGANIGNGSVLLAKSYLDSIIEPNSVAVGSPAKVIRENVIWAKDTDSGNVKTIYDCMDQEGLNYIDGNKEELSQKGLLRKKK